MSIYDTMSRAQALAEFESALDSGEPITNEDARVLLDHAKRLSNDVTDLRAYIGVLEDRARQARFILGGGDRAPTVTAVLVNQPPADAQERIDGANAALDQEMKKRRRGE